MEIPKKQKYFSHQLKTLGTIHYQKLIQNEIKAVGFMLVRGLSLYFRLTILPGVKKFPKIHKFYQVI